MDKNQFVVARINDRIITLVYSKQSLLFHEDFFSCPRSFMRMIDSASPRFYRKLMETST